MVTKQEFKEMFVEKVRTLHGKNLRDSSVVDQYSALSVLVRDLIGEKLISSQNHTIEKGEKQVYYFSIEFLLGRLLVMYLINLGIKDVCQEALEELGIALNTLAEAEEDPGLGNGGLGRLAACYLDSMASEGLAGHGCGIRYRYGLFEQQISDGYQIELPDNWLKYGYPWEYRRPSETVEVKFGGNIRVVTNGKTQYIPENYDTVIAEPYDVPSVGYKNATVNTLRLWSAVMPQTEMACSVSRNGDCRKVVEHKHATELISDILYPEDSTHEGKTLRLKQEYFLVSAGLQSIVRNHKKNYGALHNFHNKVAVHINDTHPAMAIPELMRILMDEESYGWDEAWDITTQTMSYTNHTILPEALEKWPVDLLKGLLPRIYMIIDEINERFCRNLWQKYRGEWDRIRSMAIIADGYVHMAHLCIVGSHSVNGVAKLHTEILKSQLMNNFHNFYPHKFNNKTNGVTHRRWIMKCNEELTELINDTIGAEWIDRPCELNRLLDYAADPAFQQQFAAVKTHKKIALAKYIKDKLGVTVDASSIFDAHIKRIHGYKRQTMNVLHIMDLYNRLLAQPELDIVPRTFIFAGKAAPGYYLAKKTIKWINTLADKVNQDKKIRDKIKIVFLENYNVSLAELIIPATEVSEQIPTASREACGTGNMKLMMNGAVTIGTLDGGNVEIAQAVGLDNIIIFGMPAEEVLNYYQHGGYNSWDVYHSNPRIQTVVNQLVNGFLPAGHDEFRDIYKSYLDYNDQFFVLKDFASYADAQERLQAIYKDKARWLKMCINNIAHSGKFSGDRTFAEYAIDIWKMKAEENLRCYCSADDAFAASTSGCGKIDNHSRELVKAGVVAKKSSEKRMGGYRASRLDLS